MKKTDKASIYKGFRYRIYPTPEQQAILAVQFGHARFVYNYFLSLRQETYRETKQGLNYNQCSEQLKALKRNREHDWLREADSQVLQQKLMDLNSAFINFFEGRAKYPVFKKKRDCQTIRFPQRFELKASERLIFLPKLGDIPLVYHRPIEGEVKSATVSKTRSGAYFVSLLCEVGEPPTKRLVPEVGVDLGVKHFAVLSTGEKVEHPHWLRQAKRQLKRSQKHLSRCVKGSKGYEKARLKLAKQHEKVANMRRDFLHRLSFHLTHKFGLIRVETLNVAGMLKNHSLAKSISDSGWGMFVEMLEYKGEWYGCKVEKADRFFPSSKTCHKCQYVHDGLKLSDRIWVCPTCHTEHDRDTNAAINLRDYRPKPMVQPPVT